MAEKDKTEKDKQADKQARAQKHEADEQARERDKQARDQEREERRQERSGGSGASGGGTTTGGSGEMDADEQLEALPSDQRRRVEEAQKLATERAENEMAEMAEAAEWEKQTRERNMKRRLATGGTTVLPDARVTGEGGQ